MIRRIKHDIEYSAGWATICWALSGGTLAGACGALDGIDALIYAWVDENDKGDGETLTVYESRAVTIWWWFGERHWDAPWWPDWASLSPG